MTRTAVAVERDPRVIDRAAEPELIARVVAGDRAAGRALYDAHAPAVYRLAYRLTGDPDLAQEFTQETFIRAFDQLPRFRGESALSTWLHRIAFTVTANGMRKVKRFRRRETDLEAAHPISAAHREAEPDLRARLAGAIDALPEIYRSIVVLHDVEGYTHGEIAAILGVAEGTCKSRLAVARAQLRAALADFAKQ